MTSFAYKLGTVALDSLTGLTPRCGVITGSHVANIAACFQEKGANFMVTAGKVFHICGLIVVGNTEGAAVNMLHASDAALTGGTPVTMSFSPACMIVATEFKLPIYETVPASRYIGLKGSGYWTGTIIMNGYEADT